MAFVLDGHDREVRAHVAAARSLRATDIQELMRRAVVHRFGAQRPPEPIQWLSDVFGTSSARPHHPGVRNSSPCHNGL